jgi:hypothetical protein
MHCLPSATFAWRVEPFARSFSQLIVARLVAASPACPSTDKPSAGRARARRET